MGNYGAHCADEVTFFSWRSNVLGKDKVNKKESQVLITDIDQ